VHIKFFKKMSRSDQICAIIDAQGFFVQKVFYPREISIVNDKYQICFEIVSEIDIKTKIVCFKHFSFQQHQLHGIPINKVLNDKTKKVFPISQLKQIIEEIYYRVRTNELNLFGLKNQQLSTLLSEYGIPFYNFETEEVGGELCPPLAVFDKFKSSIYCLLHANPKCNFDEKIHRCALRKACLIWVWLCRKQVSDDLVDQIFPDIFGGV
jgi:hypothetical protein